MREKFSYSFNDKSSWLTTLFWSGTACVVSYYIGKKLNNKGNGHVHTSPDPNEIIMIPLTGRKREPMSKARINVAIIATCLVVTVLAFAIDFAYFR